MSEEGIMTLDLPKTTGDPPVMRDRVVSFRVSQETKEDIDSIIKILRVSRGQWLEGVVDRDRKALSHVEKMVVDLNSLVECIHILKTYAYFAPTMPERVKMTRSLERLEKDLKQALAEVPTF